jgi:ethanolamine ammonia-lyase large subunit
VEQTVNGEVAANETANDAGGGSRSRIGPLDLRHAFVLANEFKEGDLLVGGGDDQQIREEARRSLNALRIGEIVPGRLVADGVTEALERSLDRRALSDISGLTIAKLKEILLGASAAEWTERHRSGLRSETIAAVAKVMTDAELSTVARAIFNDAGARVPPSRSALRRPRRPSRSTGQGSRFTDAVSIGSSQHFGSRIQPNSPGDDDDEILLSILEGLTYGCGDVIIGLNPASDDVDTIVRLEDLLRRVVERLKLPTRYCVLSDIVKQTRARERTRVDVGFQSLAGTSRALAGIVGLDVEGIRDLARGFDGCYFETGQGSAVTNGAAEGVDMVTLEARAYGVARHIQQATGAWTIVNDVAGFIGPEVFRTASQLERACLEDTVMAKLHGLTMGLDVCATFHMGIAPDALHETTRRIVELAAPAYLMAVAGNADPMLGYLTTSFREHPQLRDRVGRRITTAMSQRLAALDARSTASIYAAYMKEGGDRRTTDALRAECEQKVARLRERGFDLGYGDSPAVRARLDRIYAQARQALYASVDGGVLQAVSPHHVRVRTKSRDREDYLSHPQSGESIRDEDAQQIVTLAASSGVRRPQVQVVISDGLNANALNENLRAVLPPLRHELGAAGLHAGGVDVVIQNGRVRAGYHVGAIVAADAVVHLIGERPGTGLDTLSAYLTYGRDPAGQPRWSSALDHSATTAVCGIHRDGKPPSEAVGEIARLLARIVETRRSGVAL